MNWMGSSPPERKFVKSVDIWLHGSKYISVNQQLSGYNTTIVMMVFVFCWWRQVVILRS